MLNIQILFKTFKTLKRNNILMNINEVQWALIFKIM